MATISAILRTRRTNSNNESPIYIRINVADERAFKSLDIWIKKSCWDEGKELVKSRQVKDDPSYIYNEVIQTVKAKAEKIQREFHHKNALAEINGEAKEILTAAKLKSLIFNEETPGIAKVQKGFLFYCKKNLDEIEKEDRLNTWLMKRSVYRKFKTFIETHPSHGNDIAFDNITIRVVKDFYTYLIEEIGNSYNTAAKNMRILGGFFNKAIENEFISLRENPFHHIRFKTTKTDKEPLYSDEFEKLKFTDIEDPELTRTRDYFLFQIYSYGMRVGDFFTLTNKDLINGGKMIRYSMHKTNAGKELTLVPPAQSIIKKYKPDTEGWHFIFPIMEKSPEYYDTDTKLKREILRQTTAYNDKLSALADELGIKKGLSSHIARHTFAHMALSDGWTKHEIQEALGHEAVSTTEKYLRNFKNLSLDKKLVQLFNTDMKKVI